MAGGLLRIPALWPRVLRGLLPPDDPPQRHPGRRRSSCPSHFLRVPFSRSRRMPRESLDASEDLPKESRCQVALGQLEDEVPSVRNEAPAGLEQALLEARQRPALDGKRQDQ